MTCPPRPSLPYLWVGEHCGMPDTPDLDEDGFTPDERVWFAPYDCLENE